MRILAIDPGQRNIGVAISDPSGKVAFPLTILTHKSKQEDASSIVKLALEHNAEMIIIGQALDENNLPTLQSRRSLNLAQTIQKLVSIPVVLWEEYESTKAITSLQPAGKKKRKKSPLDHLSAVLILQSFIDHRETTTHE